MTVGDVVQFIDSQTNSIQLDQMLLIVQQSRDPKYSVRLKAFDGSIGGMLPSTEEDAMIIFSQELP